MRLSPALVTAILGAVGAVGVTAGTIVPTALPATTASATVADPGPGPGADRQPSCGRASDPDFPIDTRIHGGPDEYRPGGPAGTWSIDLTNSTDEVCHNIHPVIVLSDRQRALAVDQVRLQLTDDKGGWRTMSLEKSDEDEMIAVVEGGFPGFAVPGRQTVTVRARLAFTDAAGANKVVANAATVQRRGGDGDWVGESNDYRFSVGGGGRDGADPDTGTGRGTPSAVPSPGSSTGLTPGHKDGADAGTGSGEQRRTPEPSPPLGIGGLADTGSGSLAAPAIAAAVFVLAGVALVVGLRRPRKRR
ncbi:hypothetical protein [Streptomyces niveus]|uniref:hypothetical protein n=1 Tax=Streptomyces niveus TaxID=193462 RepID=UPI00344A9543